MEIGRLCMKTTGRDAGKTCVVIDSIDAHFVMIDGETRRRKCNVMHLVPMPQTVNVKKGASHDEVAKALKAVGVETRMTKPKKAAPQKPAAKPAAPKAAKPAEAKSAEKPKAPAKKPAAKKADAAKQ